MKTIFGLLLLSAFAVGCYSAEYRLLVLVDAAGLARGDSYEKVYGAVTTEWPAQDFELGGDHVRVSARLFGVETYGFSADQLRDIPLSARGKVIYNLAEKVKNCADGSLIDTTLEKHQRWRDQFREELMEGNWLRNENAVVLISFSPSLQNFQSRLPADLQAKLSIIELARRPGGSSVDTEALSDGLKLAHSAFKALVAKDQMHRKELMVAELNRTREVSNEMNNLKEQVANFTKLLKTKNEEIEKMVTDGKTATSSFERANRDSQSLSIQLAEVKALVAARDVTNTRASLPAEREPEKATNTTPPPSPNKGFGGWLLVLPLVVLVLVIVKLWPRKQWTVTIEREGAQELELTLTGKSPSTFSSAGDIGQVGSLQIRHSRQRDTDTGEAKDFFQLKAPVAGWSLENGAIKTLLPPEEWISVLNANTRYAIYTDSDAETPSMRFTIEDRN